MIALLKYIFLIIKAILICSFYCSYSFAQNNEVLIKKIIVDGEKRVSEGFILNFLPDYPNTKFTKEILNEFTKNLYKTDFFSKINLQINDNLLIIKVKEHPIINDITFSGNSLIEKEELIDIISIQSRDVFNLENVNDAVEKIRLQYQKIGRYLAEVSVKKVDLKDGRININFDIKEGSLLVVKNINFVGNKKFSDNELRSKISTKEDAWYKIFGSNKFIPERLEYDKEKLEDFYNERGYMDFKVISAKGDLLPNMTGFNINFLISEGQRYKVGNISIISSSISEIQKNTLINKIFIKKNEYYDSRALDESIKLILKYFEKEGFNFIQVFPKFKKNKNIVAIDFSILEGKEKYINKINIVGNTRTIDTVIRRELTLFEGDPFNKNKLNFSINSLRRLGYFETVNYKLEDVDDNLLDIIIDVKEINTGSVSLGIGYSSLNKTNFIFGLKERNFLGEGKKVNLEASLSDQKSTYKVGITEPFFMDRHLSLSGDIFNEELENTKGDIKTSKNGFGFGIGFKKENITQNLSYKLSVSETTTSSNSTANSQTGEEGIEIVTSAVSHTLLSDTTDSFFNPKSGNRWRFTNSFAGIGGDAAFFKSIFNSKSYFPINYNDYTFAVKTGLGMTTGFDEKITSSNRFALGGQTLRGFDSSGVGPRDTGNNQAVGGNYFYNLSFELRSDEWMPDDTGIEWIVFSDIGSLWGTDYKTGVQGYNDSEPRITTGLGFGMTTPVGPLQLLWGFPLSSKNYDLEETFQFSIGTSF